MYSSLSRVGGLALLWLLFPVASYGDLIIDDFSTGEYVSPLGQDVGSFENLHLGSMLGGARRSFGNTSFPNSVDAEVSVADGSWCVQNASGGIRQISMTWGQTSSGPGTTDTALNLDFSNLDQFFQYDIASVEANTRLILRLYSGVDEGNAASGGHDHLFDETSTTSQTISVGFDDLAYSLIDFTDIDGIEVLLDFQRHDICLTELRVGEPTAVPEPATWMVIAAAICPVAVRRRRMGSPLTLA